MINEEYSHVAVCIKDNEYLFTLQVTEEHDPSKSLYFKYKDKDNYKFVINFEEVDVSNEYTKHQIQKIINYCIALLKLKCQQLNCN